MKKFLLLWVLINPLFFAQTRYKDRNAASRVTMYLYEDKSTLSKFVLDYPVTGLFDVLDFDDEWALINYNGYKGYVVLEYIEDYKELKMKDKDYFNKLAKAFGKINAKKILEEKIWLGMTGKMAIKSWGFPDNINKTVTASSITEQWVYGDTYLYFRNDKLESWQEHK